MTDYASLIMAYLYALEAGAQGDALARFFTEDAEQIEFPNQLNPNGGTSTLAQLLERAKRVPELLESQRYDVESIFLTGVDSAAVEATWYGTLRSGVKMTAHFAMFFEFKFDRICRQRNYDCFEPW